MTQPPEWSIRCPWCQAPPGTRCTSPRGRRLAITSHDARTTTHARLNATHGAAERAAEYLLSSGYTITPDHSDQQTAATERHSA